MYARQLVFLLISVSNTILAQVSNNLPEQARQQSPSPYFNAIIVSNADSSETWYSKVLDLKERNRYVLPERGIKQIILYSDKILLELIEIKSSYNPSILLENKEKGARLQGLTKMGFYVENLDEFHEKLVKLNVVFYGNTVKDPVSGDRTFLVYDPDKNIVQFFGK